MDGFIQSVCPNLDVAMRKLATWLSEDPAETETTTTSPNGQNVSDANGIDS